VAKALVLRAMAGARCSKLDATNCLIELESSDEAHGTSSELPPWRRSGMWNATVLMSRRSAWT
jgi:hypothetical protein